MIGNLVAGAAAVLVAVSPVLAPAASTPNVTQASTDTALVGAVSPLPADVIATGKLESGQNLASGDTLKSPGGQFKVIMQKEGNLVLYNAANQPLWSSPTAGNPGSRVVMQKEGNLVIYNGANKAVWATPTAGNPGAHLEVRDDGKLVVVSNRGAVLWSAR